MVRALVCDGCLRCERVPRPEPGIKETLPEPWREVVLPGWVGAFHVCGESCVQLLKDRLEPLEHG